MMKRDNNLDFFRGIAAIWIIFIHTCFKSGMLYLPNYMRAISLIIDVPLFMFISGMSFNYSSLEKNIKGIVKLWYKYIIFCFIYNIILFIFENNSFTVKGFISSIFFKFEANKLLTVVDGSIWFIFMYIVVSLIGSIIISIYNKYNKDWKNYIYVLLLVFLLYGMQLYNGSFLFIKTEYLMYLFIYLLGYYCYNLKIKNVKWFILLMIGNIVLLLGLFKYNRYGFLDMQTSKFEYNFNYLVYSMISILLVMFLKDRVRIKKNIFCLVGKNALLFYFAQGVGSSLIYYIYPYLGSIKWYFKLVIMYSSNVVITSLFVIGYYYIIKLVEWVFKKIKIEMFLEHEEKRSC